MHPTMSHLSSSVKKPGGLGNQNLSVLASDLTVLIVGFAFPCVEVLLGNIYNILVSLNFASIFSEGDIVRARYLRAHL